jgi:hypothetical protein
MHTDVRFSCHFSLPLEVSVGSVRTSVYVVFLYISVAGLVVFHSAAFELDIVALQSLILCQILASNCGLQPVSSLGIGSCISLSGLKIV